MHAKVVIIAFTFLVVVASIVIIWLQRRLEPFAQEPNCHPPPASQKHGQQSPQIQHSQQTQQSQPTHQTQQSQPTHQTQQSQPTHQTRADPHPAPAAVATVATVIAQAPHPPMATTVPHQALTPIHQAPVSTTPSTAQGVVRAMHPAASASNAIAPATAPTNTASYDARKQVISMFNLLLDRNPSSEEINKYSAQGGSQQSITTAIMTDYGASGH